MGKWSTLVRGVHGNVDGRASHRAVAEYQHPTLPCVRIRSFNIAGLARSNFKAGVDIDGRRAIIFNNPMKPTIVTLHIDVENVSTGVNVALVNLRGEGETFEFGS